MKTYAEVVTIFNESLSLALNSKLEIQRFDKPNTSKRFTTHGGFNYYFMNRIKENNYIFIADPLFRYYYNVLLWRPKCRDINSYE